MNTLINNNELSDSGECLLETLEMTKVWGLKFGQKLNVPSVVILRGDLGAGKTTLTKSIAQIFGIDPNMVTSPTFALTQHYDFSDGVLIHLDLYRILENNPDSIVDSLDSLGLFDYQPKAIIIIEWGDTQVAKILSDHWWEVDLEIITENTRKIHWMLNE